MPLFLHPSLALLFHLPLLLKLGFSWPLEFTNTTWSIDPPQYELAWFEPAQISQEKAWEVIWVGGDKLTFSNFFARVLSFALIWSITSRSYLPFILVEFPQDLCLTTSPIIRWFDLKFRISDPVFVLGYFGSDIWKNSDFRIRYRSNFFHLWYLKIRIYFFSNEIWQQAEGNILLTHFQCTKLLNCGRVECMAASCQVAQHQPLINYVCNIDCRLPLSTY